MNNLLSLVNAADKPAVIEENFERLDESLAYTRTPTRVNDVLTDVKGPPAIGTWPLYQVWVDALCALWLCTVAGTPGTWVQVEAAPVTEFPNDVPDGYIVLLDGVTYRYHLATDSWPRNSGGGNTNMLFSSEGAIITGYYVGGRYRYTVPTEVVSASIVATAPVGADQLFALEVDGVLTGDILTLPAAATEAEVDLGSRPVAVGKYIRWKCTASPAAENAASQIHITTNMNT